MRIEQQKFFALCFMSRLSHNDINTPGYMDLPLHDLLTKLFQENLVENTYIILMSDHGIRYGPIRQTFTGKLEERLPVFTLRLPGGLKHPNVTINQHRLTSHFDTHSTLRHILEGHPPRDLPFGRSLLEEIPPTRTCNSIGLKDHWCTCAAIEKVGNLSLVANFASLIAESVNSRIKDTKCQKFTAKRIVSAFRNQLNSKMIGVHRFDYGDESKPIFVTPSPELRFQHYLVTVEAVTPDGHLAMFEATVRTEANDVSRVMGDISRIDEYRGTDTSCTDIASLAKYCICS